MGKKKKGKNLLGKKKKQRHGKEGKRKGEGVRGRRDLRRKKKGPKEGGGGEKERKGKGKLLSYARIVKSNATKGKKGGKDPCHNSLKEGREKEKAERSRDRGGKEKGKKRGAGTNRVGRRRGEGSPPCKEKEKGVRAISLSDEKQDDEGRGAGKKKAGEELFLTFFPQSRGHRSSQALRGGKKKASTVRTSAREKKRKRRKH